MFSFRVMISAMLVAISVNSAFASVFYVATTGSDTNSGTISQPFLTIQRAQTAVSAGDTVYIRGGTYTMTSDQIAKTDATWVYVNYLDKSGTSGKMIKYWAYPGEKPIFDFQNIKPSLRINAFQVNGSWIHLKGFEVIGVQVTISTHTQSECFENQGSNNIYEQLSMHDGQAIGFYLTRGSNNLILNCDAYRNWDNTSENKLGGNVDGFGNHPVSASHTNNIFRGCRAWFNSDDGYDCISAHTATVFENCWAFYNGYSSSFASLGDGNGFKAGGYGTTAFDKLPVTIPSNIVRFCLAVRNKSNGFYSNHHLAGSVWYNNTGYYNASNYNMLNRKAKTEADYLTDVSGYNHIMRNNLGYGARSSEVTSLDQSASDAAGNYFNLPVSVASADFLSLDMASLTQDRQSDGSLPDINLMKLASGSDLIDAGQDIGFPFYSSKPDLGYREFGLNYLPVGLLYFKGSRNTTSVNLNWMTQSELNNDHFDIERSVNGLQFEKIGTVKGSGTSSITRNYSFTDSENSGQAAYYRLKQADNNGDCSYSSIVNIAAYYSFAFYPNPAGNFFYVNIANPTTSGVIISIYDISGKQFRAERFSQINPVVLNLTGIPAGIYFLEVADNETKAVMERAKFIKQ